ncbi:MAG TPA: YqiA/YcfP family alpha/beta fold hydrolase [Holophagaceae bacterium]|nr:YqiA/YcfP family alpha/beta fold hydrolase [Holophagaceae bacterium]
MTALVYLHGFSSAPGGSKGSFCRRWAEARGIPFHAPDLNLPSFESLTVTAQVEAVESLLWTLPDPPVLVGSSLGGFIAAAVAYRGARIRSLLLLAPAIGFAARRMASPAWAGYRETGEAQVYHYGQQRMLRLGSALREDLPDWRGDAAWRIAVPTILLHGRRDESVPLSESEAFAARNPSAILHILDDDHGLLAPASLALLTRVLEEAFP